MTAGKTSADGVGDRLLKAVSHPLRIEILRLLGDRVASPKEIAGETGADLGDVSYHVKYLLQKGDIEIVDTALRRGAVEHFYRLKACPPTEEAIRGLVGEAVRALNAGTVEPSRETRLRWATLALDKEGRRELGELQARWDEELERLAVDAAERLAAQGKPGKPVVAAILGFDGAPGLSRGSGASGAGA